jgi:hypothetical protein
MSFDGFLYLIDGKSACAHTVDIGEASYAAVLVDDLAGDGLLELLVATMNGNVYMLQVRMQWMVGISNLSCLIRGSSGHWCSTGLGASCQL